VPLTEVPDRRKSGTRTRGETRPPARIDGSWTAPVFKPIGRTHIDGLGQEFGFTSEQIDVLKAVSAVLPFRTNSYVLHELIDWARIPDDPIFQLVFPQAGMLSDQDRERMLRLVRRGATDGELEAAAKDIRAKLNPHPAGQMELNLPVIDGTVAVGLQHKYARTVLFFPSSGQTCHAYCNYCFRWAQFVGDPDLKMAERDTGILIKYVTEHPEISDVILTGGDPLIMPSRLLARHVLPLLELEQVETIRLGTKSLAYWPYRFLTDTDADALRSLMRRVVRTGRRLVVMAHFSHPRELETAASRAAIEAVLETGASIYCQAPVVAHVNADADVWATLWRQEFRLGCVPYYMFVERDTGPQDYFKIPLVRALEIYQQASQRVSGLARTIRGPVMSATPGKVAVEGTVDLPGSKRAIVLRMLQARRREDVGRMALAAWDPTASWLDELRPLDDGSFFFDEPAPMFRPPAATNCSPFVSSIQAEG
jgi:L-lysine 2,3-aminomutase